MFILYGKVKNVIGFGVLEDDDVENPSGFGTGGWREGRALIERENQSGSEGTTLGMSPRGASLDLERGSGSAGTTFQGVTAVEGDDMASPVGAPAPLYCFGSEGSLVLAFYISIVFVVGFRI